MQYKTKYRAARRKRRMEEAVVVCGAMRASAGGLHVCGDKIQIREMLSADLAPAAIRKKILGAGTVILAGVPQVLRDDLIQFCFERDIRCYVEQTVCDVMLRSARNVQLRDTSLLLLPNAGLTSRQRLGKRAFDIVGALAGICLASPLMALIALCIKLDDGGPVLFTQNRLTEGGKVFRIYKFRSMQPADGQQGYVLTRKNDSRLTAVGRVIRRLHLDELPQLVNILRGEMSFVGPRPECPELAAEYRKVIPQFDYRLKARAGLTGFAQVYGKYNSAPADKLKLDLHYIANYSFFLDMKLIFRTFRILFHREKSEGIDPWQTSAAPGRDGDGYGAV